ncbi:MAG TPA: ABC transporter permease [Rhodopila sp.]
MHQRPASAAKRRRFTLEPGLLQLSPTALLMLLFLIVPLAVMLGMSFFRSTIFGIETTPSLANYAKLFTEPMYSMLLLKSLRMALLVTVIVLLISFPVAFWLAKVVRRWKLPLLTLIFIPYWVNYVIRTYAWMPLLGRSGVINYLLLQLGVIDHPIDALLYDEFAVQLVLVYVFLPFGIVPLYLSLERLDNNLLQASADLGAPPLATLRHVILPLAAPGLAGSAMTVFVLSVGSYVTPRLVGGPTGMMFGNIIADQFGASFNWSWGATLSVALTAATLILVALVARKVPIARVFLSS